MGWTSFYVGNTKDSRRQILEAHTSYRVGNTWPSGDAVIDVETLAEGPGGVYGILKKTYPDGKVLRFALVVLVERGKGEFAYKEMTEFDGPVEHRMPLRLLKKLSPLEELQEREYSDNSLKYAAGWRQAVKYYHAKQSIQVGDILVFDAPLTFNLEEGSVPVSRFEVKEWGRRRRFYALADGRQSFGCRISKSSLLNNAYKVIPRQTG